MSTDTTPDFVELDRRFDPLESSESPESTALHSYTIPALWGDQTGLDWAALLEKPLVVVLGEPGSGKTREFQERAKLLTAQGNLALYVRLDQLPNLSLSQLLDTAEARQFDAWLRSDGMATFFLDSVDEAKFTRLADFHSALKRFANDLGVKGIRRCTILLSCRASEWQPESDAHEVVSQLHPSSRPLTLSPAGRVRGRGRPGWLARLVPSRTREIQDAPERNEGSILVVKLQPLDEGRVEQFVRKRRLPNVDQFVRALHKSHAWEFVRRPIDVLDLANYWEKNGRLGTLSDLIAYNVDFKLRPAHRDVVDPLSPQDAQQGAEALGAATVLCGKFSFKIPDETFLSVDGLDPVACLPADWPKAHVRAFLARPIFDAAAFGRVRFHHRRIAEYLAAKWIAKRMAEGCPITELEELLFDTVGRTRVLRPRLAPVTVWLCCGEQQWNDDVRTWVRASYPSVHLQFGDPACLPLAYRRRILRALATQGSGRKRMWIDSSSDALTRLAAPELAEDISTLVRDHTLPHDLRSEMIQLVRYSRLEQCLPTLLELLADAQEIETLKTYAAAAIRDMGNDDSRRRLAAIAARYPQLRSHLCGIICQAIYPGFITAPELCQLILKADESESYVGDLPYQLKSHLAAKIDEVEPEELLKCLLELAGREPHKYTGHNGLKISERYGWVADVFPKTLIAIFNRPSLLEEDVRLAALALHMLGHFRHHADLDDRDANDLNPASVSHPKVRREYFWRLVSEFRSEHNDEPKFLSQIFDFYEVLRPVPADFNWLSDDAHSQKDAEDRQLAFRFAFELALTSPNRRTELRQLKRLADDDSLLRAILRKLVSSHRFLWAKRLWYRQIQSKFGCRWWWLRKARWSRNKWHWWRSQVVLLRHLKSLAAGNRISWLAHLSAEAEENRNHRWAPDTWKDLTKKRGRLVTWAAKTGCKRAWKNFWPPLPHEEPVPNQTDPRIIVGLSGLQAEAHDRELDFAKLTATDTRLAARYGVNELNGFAPWLADLARSQPNTLREVLEECVQGEWNFPSDYQHAHEVVNKLLWQGEQFDSLVQDKIWQLLQTSDPPNPFILQSAITILLRSEQHREDLAKLAEQRASAAPVNSRVFTLWVAVLLQLDAERALNLLEGKLGNDTTADQVVINVCAALNGRYVDKAPVIDRPSFRETSNLRRFILLVYQRVRPSDDVRHFGGYTPDARDDAQDFRETLLDRLSKSDESGATDVLRELITEPLLKDYASWIEHLLEERRKRDADFEPWMPSDIRVFETEHEINPKTDRDLFAIGRKRLRDIKYDVEKSENSLRGDLRAGDVEQELRRWLQRELQRRSRQRYVVPQEEEIDLQQRPDLRLHNPHTAPVGIEVKWAENWTVTQLLERLENQLVGQYLRDYNAQYGIYVLGLIDPTRRFWKNPSDGTEFSFDQVVEIVTQAALRITLSRADILDIFVIPIDFRIP